MLMAQASEWQGSVWDNAQADGEGTGKPDAWSIILATLYS